MSSSFDDKFRNLHNIHRPELVNALPLYADEWRLITYASMRRPARRAWETRLSLKSREGRWCHCYLTDYELRRLAATILVNIKTRRRRVSRAKPTP